MSSVDFAIVTAVPVDHLVSGEAVARERGFVALGVDAARVFEEVDASRGSEPVPVLFYASHQQGGAPEVHQITWIGRYVGHVNASDGRHPLGMTHRPPSTVNDGTWKTFYHIEGLRELAAGERIAIDSLEKYKKRGAYRANARVRRPELVVRPGSI